MDAMSLEPIASTTGSSRSINSTGSSKAGKGHRRVKSLVREFDSVQTEHGVSYQEIPTDPSLPSPHTSNASSGGPRRKSSHDSLPPLSIATYNTLANGFRSVSLGSSGSAAPSALKESDEAEGESRVHLSPGGGINGTQSNQSSWDAGFPFGQNSALGVQCPTPPSSSDAGATHDDTEEDDVFLPFTTGSGPEFTFGSGSASPAATSSSSRGAHDSHMRRHSRIHSRNLSVFFPRPGEAVTGTLAFNNLPASPPSVTIPSAKVQGYGFSTPMTPLTSGSTVPSPQSANSRRGHHHRHSLSHNFFPFLDPTQTCPPGQSPSVSPTTLSAVPKVVPQVLSHHSDSAALPSNLTQSLRSRYSHLPSPIRLLIAIAFYTPITTQVKLAIGLTTVCLGIALWIYGQAGESLAVTGLGYIVVFDGLGALSRIWLEGRAAGIERVWNAWGVAGKGDRGIRLPFGIRRQVTLSHFAQCVYLLFSAIYVCKESMEHVLLLHGPVKDLVDGASGHGAAHGSMGHDEGIGFTGGAVGDLLNEADISIPTRVLLACFGLCLFSAVGSGNHAGLAEASGPSAFSASSPRDNSSSPEDIILSILANPFVLITLLFSGGIAVASAILPNDQLAPLDKVIALLEAVAMFYIAYPAAVATGAVLLQTAPPLETGQMASLAKGLRQIQDHPSVIFVEPPRIWQMVPQFHAHQQAPSSLTHRPSQPSLSSQASVVVASITVHVQVEATDRDILEVTRFAREKCSAALRWATSLSRDLDQRKGSIDAGAGGELTVGIIRGLGDGRSNAPQCQHEHPSDGHMHRTH